VDFIVYDKEIYHQAGEPTIVNAYVRNPNLYDVFNPKVYVVSETSSGQIAEYGMKAKSGILTPDLGDYKLENMKLNDPAKTPKYGRTYFYVVGARH
jgi:hypothetical protein